MEFEAKYKSASMALNAITDIQSFAFWGTKLMTKVFSNVGNILFYIILITKVSCCTKQIKGLYSLSILHLVFSKSNCCILQHLCILHFCHFYHLFVILSLLSILSFEPLNRVVRTEIHFQSCYWTKIRKKCLIFIGVKIQGWDLCWIFESSFS